MCQESTLQADERWRLLCEQQVAASLGSLNEHYPTIQKIVEQGGARTEAEETLQQAGMRVLLMMLTNSKVSDDYFGLGTDEVGDILGPVPCKEGRNESCAECATKDDCLILEGSGCSI